MTSAVSVHYVPFASIGADKVVLIYQIVKSDVADVDYNDDDC